MQLSPLSFIARTAYIYPGHIAVVYNERSFTWAQTYERCRRLASALVSVGVTAGDTVAVMLDNVPAMFESHFGVPMAGAVLNTLNTRLDAESIAFMLQHGEAKVLLTDREFSPVVEKALAMVPRRPLVIDVDDPSYEGGKNRGTIEYESFLEQGSAAFEWTALPISQRAERNGRQGVPYHMQEAITVLNPETMEPVPWDGETMGEIMFRGNLVMKGYLKNPSATDEAFRGGWFHTGDLAVMHPDGYVKIKDRSKDVIISGGENISSLEVEEALYRHPAVMMAAVVAKPDQKWGEVPCAFVEVKDGTQVTENELIEHCRSMLARFKVPKSVIICKLPKTSTGKIQKFILRQQVKSAQSIE